MGSSYPLVAFSPLLFLAIILVFGGINPSFAAHDHALRNDGFPPLFSSDYNSSMMWGTYRPGIYFGTRTRTAQSLLTGLMWSKAETPRPDESIRHRCEMNDNLRQYGWLKHDGRTFGTQKIVDQHNNIIIYTDFVKISSGDDDAEYSAQGGDWALRVRGEPLNPSSSSSIRLFYYVGNESEEELKVYGSHKLSGKSGKKPLQGSALIHGHTDNLGDFSVYMEGTHVFKSGKRAKSVEDEEEEVVESNDYEYVGYKSNGNDVWKVQEHLEKYIRQAAYASMQKQMKLNGKNKPWDPNTPLDGSLPNGIADDKSNVIIVSKTLQAPFEFSVAFLSHAMHPSASALKTPSAARKTAATSLIGASFSKLFDAKVSQFDAKFERVFGLKSKGQYSKPQVDFAAAALSNMLGGIGYFYGSSIIEDTSLPADNNVYLGPAHALFTAVPSRSFFPRGFLWDEGFHNLLIQRWDSDLTLDILSHWFAITDQHGWIPREQILGDEALSRVPSEFQRQKPSVANPPTLFLSALTLVESLLSKKQMNTIGIDVNGNQVTVSADEGEEKADAIIIEARWKALKQMYPQMKKNMEWYRRTQKGNKADSFRWRGRTVDHLLSSGLDDYPRGGGNETLPSTMERHLDLHCWMAMASDLLANIAEKLNDSNFKADAVQYRGLYDKLKNNLEEMHMDKSSGLFADYVGNTKTSHSAHVGYVSLFPVLVGLLPADSPHLKQILRITRDPNQLWSSYGLRSLSKSDSLFGTSENYWRGPIWINMNYLMIHALRTHYLDNPNISKEMLKQVTELQQQLKDNLVRNMFKEYERTGYIWEQYSPHDGKGQRSHPFTGWSALITLIMADD